MAETILAAMDQKRGASERAETKWSSFTTPLTYRWLTRFRSMLSSAFRFFVPWFNFSAPFWMTSHFRCEKHSASCFAVCRCGKVQALLFCIVLRCLLEGSSFIILHRASLFVGRFKLYYSASCFAVCWKVQALLLFGRQVILLCC